MRTLISILWISFFPLAAAAQGDDLSYRLKKVIKDKKAEIAGLIGADVTDKILERLDTVDGYALDQLLLYIRETYLEAKVKNLQAAKAGRSRK